LDASFSFLKLWLTEVTVLVANSGVNRNEEAVAPEASDEFQEVALTRDVGANTLAYEHSICLHPELWSELTAIELHKWFSPRSWRYWALMLPSFLLFLLNGWWRVAAAWIIQTLGGRGLSVLVGSGVNRCFTVVSKFAYELRELVTSSGSLAIVYNYVVWSHMEGLHRQLTWGERYMRFHMMQPDAVAVRLRAIKTFEQALKRLENLLTDPELGPTFTVESPLIFPVLACGNAQAEIDAVYRLYQVFPEFRGRVKLHLVDATMAPLRAAADYAENRGLEGNFEIFCMKLRPYLRMVKEQGWKIYILDIVGFLDYYSGIKIASLLAFIKDVVQKGAMIITALISKSKLAFSVRWSTNWPLLRRYTREQFTSFLLKAGFEGNITIISCIDVHFVAVITV
jgi:hypothetical protein